MNKTLPIFVAALVIPLVAVAAQPARILILTGQSDTQYHYWRSPIPFIERILLNTGRFDVRVQEETKGLTRDALAQYDAVILNYQGPRWGPGPEAALQEFVRAGKGIVSFHGVSYGPLMGTAQRAGGGWQRMDGWPEYPNLIGA